MKKIKNLLLMMLAAVTILGTGCASKKTNSEDSTAYAIQGKELSEPVDKVSSANNKVAFKFLSSTVKDHSKDNFIISPLSLSTLLAFTQNGAVGKTKEEMLQALELQGYDDASINDGYKNIIANFNSLASMKTKMADSIWINKGQEVKDEFKVVGKDYYEALAKELDLNQDSAIDEINKWISDQTSGKVNKVLDYSNKGASMALINTIYLKAKWSPPFEPQPNFKFTASDGKTKNVSGMRKLLNIQYMQGDKFEAVRIPYEDTNFGMYVFLPDKKSNVNALMKQMTYDNWNKWTSEFKERDVNVQLPKFKMEYEENLNEMLKSFGMKKAFSKEAELSKISNSPLYIELVKQKCYIDVNETGTEVAAATAELMLGCAAPNDKLINFIADRPFIFVIADKKSGLIMFMGKVERP